MAVGFSNIPAGDGVKTPLFFAEMDNSMANSATSSMRRLIVGVVNDTSVEPEIGKLTAVGSVADAKRIGGEGSMLAQMYEIWRKNDALGETWVLPIKQTEGTAAAGSVKITGTATEAGMLTVYVAGKRLQVTVSKGMTSTEAGAALEKAITEASSLPVSAKATTGTVALTSKFKGTAGNDIAVELNRGGRASGEVTPAGLTVEITAMANGTGVPDFTEALAAMGDEAFEFICMPFADTASLDAWRDFMCDETGRWSFTKQLYGHVYSALRGTYSELVTAGGKRNDQHMTVVGVEKDAPNPVWEHAAAFAARVAVFISADPARPVQTGTLVGITPSRPEGRFTQFPERNALLGYGIATTYTTGGVQCIERAVTTYQKNKFSQPDTSYMDAETLHTSSYVIQYLRGIITSKFARSKLANDGTRFGSGQPIVTPKVIRGELIAAYAKLENIGIVENADAFAEALIVERDPVSVNRVNVLLPPDYVNQLRVFALLNQFRLQY